jgi:hypothetical protein
MLMNNEFVAEQAEQWSQRMLQVADREQRVQRMYQAAFARPAEAGEVRDILAFADEQKPRPEPEVWGDIAHMLLNAVEFIYLP